MTALSHVGALAMVLRYGRQRYGDCVGVVIEADVRAAEFFRDVSEIGDAFVYDGTTCVCAWPRVVAERVVGALDHTAPVLARLRRPPTRGAHVLRFAAPSEVTIATLDVARVACA